MRVKKSDLAKLRNEEHFQFVTDVKHLVETAGALALNIDQLFPLFTDLYDKEDVALEAIRKSSLTDPITDADTNRDSIYRGFVLLVETYSHSTDAGKVQAARNIQVVIDHYGDFRLKSYNEETASIYNFLQDVNARCAADVTILNAQDWITDLQNANQAFDSLMNQRFDTNAGQEYINLRETRREIDNIYTQMIERVNASILLNGESAYADFVSKLNERVDYFKHTVTQRKGRAAAKKENKQKEIEQ